MTEWAYRANARKRDLDDTRKLADEHGFLARSAYTRKKKHAAIAFVQEVKAGDVIHFYYREKRDIEPLGSYRVLDAHDDAARFQPAFPLGEAALVKLDPGEPNAALVELLRKPSRKGEGYQEDPKLQAFTGWRIERLADVSPPDFSSWRFPQKGTLTRNRSTGEAASREALLARITHDVTVMAGRACIRGLRVTVGTIVNLLAAGRTEQEILDEYPYLEEADLRASLLYAAWRLQERETPLEAA
jgi:uncharacterized protein (DUF433 family)